MVNTTYIYVLTRCFIEWARSMSTLACTPFIFFGMPSGHKLKFNTGHIDGKTKETTMSDKILKQQRTQFNL